MFKLLTHRGKKSRNRVGNLEGKGENHFHTREMVSSDSQEFLHRDRESLCGGSGR